MEHLKWLPSSVGSAHLPHLQSKYLLSLRCLRLYWVPARVRVYVLRISSPFLMGLAALTRQVKSSPMQFWVLGEQLEFIMAVRGKTPRMLEKKTRIFFFISHGLSFNKNHPKSPEV